MNSGREILTNRLFDVWKIFSDGKVHKIRMIAPMFAVSTKTIQRDIEHLRDLGCDFESNKNGMNLRGIRLVKSVCPCCQKEVKP